MHGGEGHGTGSGTATAPTVERDFEVGQLTRVEGEGSLRLVVRDGKVVEARLAIFEAPRYFEQLVVGRTPDDVLDIVARICGICPVAYQMSAVHAFEDALRRRDRPGRPLAPPPALLRRVDREPRPPRLPPPRARLPGRRERASSWPPSTAAPSSAAWRSRRPATTSSRLARRAADPPGQRPRRRLQPGAARERAGGPQAGPRPGRRAVAGDGRLGGRLPRRRRTSVEPARLVALRHATDYPMNDGRIVSTDGIDIANTDWSTTFRESQVEWLQRPPGAHARRARPTWSARRRASRSPASSSTRWRPRRWIGPASPTRSAQPVPEHRRPRHRAGPCHRRGARHRRPTIARPPRRTSPGTPRPGTAAWATEAPRGLLFHELRARRARPRRLGPHRAADEPEPGRHRGRPDRLRAVRPGAARAPRRTSASSSSSARYDPCISCATHFLDVTVEREP